jgi:hypothetical protein
VAKLVHRYAPDIPDDVREFMGARRPVGISSFRAPTAPAAPQIDPAVGEYARRTLGETMQEPAVEPQQEAMAEDLPPLEDLAVAPAMAQQPARKQTPQPSGRAPRSDNTGLAFADAFLSGIAEEDFDHQYWQGLEDRKDKKAATAKKEAELAEQKRIALEEADPNSQRSQQARAVHMGMLRQLGVEDDVLSAFSAKDINELPKGNIMMKIAEVRARVAADASEMERKAQEAEAKRKYDEEQWAQRNAITSEQAMERARTMSGMSSGRMVQSALLHDDLARQRAAEEEQRRIAAEERKRAAEGKPDPENYSLPGTVVVDRARLKQTVTDDVQRRKLEDAVSSFRTMQESLKQMQDLRRKHGIEVANESVISQYNTARNNYMAGQAVLAGTGVINPGEREIFVESLPDISGSTKDFKALMPGSGDPVLKALEGTEKAVFGGINARLATFGGVRLGPAGNAGNGSSHDRASQPLATDVDGDGIVTVHDIMPQKPRGKKSGAKPTGAPAGVRIRDPKTGKTGSFHGTAQEAQAAGYEVIGG